MNYDEDFFEEPDPDARPFPEGWTSVGATEEPIEVTFVAASDDPLDRAIADYAADAVKGMVLGPARLYTQPVESPVFEAIDRASEDRTPVLDLPAPATASWLKVEEAVKGFAAVSKGFTKTVETAAASWEAIRELYEGMEPVRHRVTLMGTGYRRHAVPRERPDESRAAYARRRRLYSERLRRDRRRRRAGRAPILRSSAFQMLIPHAQIDVTKAGPELAEMEIVLSASVPPDQVYIVDTDLLKHQPFVEPLALQEPWDDFNRAARQYRMYESFGRGYGRTHRATNYFQQGDAAARMDAGITERAKRVIKGYKPSRMWVDDVEVDVDTWMNEGGAE